MTQNIVVSSARVYSSKTANWLKTVLATEVFSVESTENDSWKRHESRIETRVFFRSARISIRKRKRVVFAMAPVFVFVFDRLQP